VFSVGASLPLIIPGMASEDRLVYAMTTTKERHLFDQSMDELERRLDPGRFLRIHRTCIVNLAHAEMIPGHLGRDAVLRLKDGTELDVSRDRVRALRERLGL